MGEIFLNWKIIFFFKFFYIDLLLEKIFDNKDIILYKKL